MDRLKRLEVFVKVAKAGSFAAASRELDMTPAMIGRHIQNLEEYLGVILINRTTRNHHLTVSGQQFLVRCENILSDIKNAEITARENMRDTPYTLRITAPILLGTEFLVDILVEYMSKNPKISIDLSLSDGYEDLINKKFDLAVRIGKMADSSLIARSVGQYRFILCASPSYLARNGVPKKPEDLTQHSCLATGYGGREHAWEFIGMDDVSRRVKINSRFRINNRGALRSAAISGGGIIMQPVIGIESSIKSGKLVELMPDWKIPAKPINLIWNHEIGMGKQYREFIEYLVVQLKNVVDSKEYR